jgi:uncharacterized membrane protein
MDDLWITRAVHIVCGTLWVGGLAFNLFIVGPAIAGSGAEGRRVLTRIFRRHKMSVYLGLLSTLTIATGAYAYARLGYHHAPMLSGKLGVLNLGVVAGILLFVEGLVLHVPSNHRLRSFLLDDARADDESTYLDLLRKKRRLSTLSVLFALTALVCMSAWRLA